MNLVRHTIFTMTCILIGTTAIKTVPAATTIVSIGDGITAGSTLPDTTKRFSSLLTAMLSTTCLTKSIVNLPTPVSVHNRGISASTVLKKGTLSFWEEPAFSQIFTLKPDIVTLMMGTNATKAANLIHSTEFESDFTAMVDTLLSISSHPKVIICIPPPVFSNSATHSDSALQKSIIPLLQKVAQKKGLPIIDARTPFLDKQSLFATDGVHPDSTGHKLLADIYYEGIINNALNQRHTTKLLWYGRAPGSTGLESDTTAKPMLKIYPALPPATSAAILVCPGGGYDHLSTEKEGNLVGEWLASKGITAFVLRYRYKPYLYPVPFYDAKRAMRIVRSSAEQFGIDTTKVGILGFSAGGHLASLVGVHHDPGDGAAADPIEVKKSTPDFMALIYPVITFTDTYTHTGSRNALLGTSPAPTTVLLDSLSTYKWVTAQTPQTFLSHGSADASVPIQNSRMFDSSCTANSVPHFFMTDPAKPHGYGMAGTWPDSLLAWLNRREILSVNSGLASPIPHSKISAGKVLCRNLGARGFTLTVSDSKVRHAATAYSVTGRAVESLTQFSPNEYLWHPKVKGMYIIRITGDGFNYAKRVTVGY